MVCTEGKRCHPVDLWQAWEVSLRGKRLEKFKKLKCKVLCVDQSNSKHKHSLRDKWIENSFDKKGLEVLVDKKFNIRWKHLCNSLGSQTISYAASRELWHVGSGRWFSLSIPLMRFHLQYCILGSPTKERHGLVGIRKKGKIICLDVGRREGK